MTQRISRFSIHQSAKTLALVYFIVGFIYVPIGYLADSASPPDERLGLLWLLAPVFVLVLAYLTTALLFGLYNFIAGKTGGVEFNLAGSASDSELGV